MLVGVSLFLQYTNKTHEDIAAVRTELSHDIKDLRTLLTEHLIVLTQDVGKLQGQSHIHTP